MHIIKLNLRCSKYLQQIGKVLSKLIIKPSLIVKPRTTTKQSLVVVTLQVAKI
jgi:hypothetical protein